MDEFNQKYLKRIKESQDDDDLEQTIDKIYEDGFQDGVNEK